MGVGNNSHQKHQFTAPPPADLADPNDGEIWLDLVTAAIKGYTGAAWAKKGGDPIVMVSTSVASKCAVEVADAVFAEFKKRRK